jgi:hypothetical protein
MRNISYLIKTQVFIQKTLTYSKSDSKGFQFLVVQDLSWMSKPKFGLLQDISLYIVFQKKKLAKSHLTCLFF